jgi:hypothetical protein
MTLPVQTLPPPPRRIRRRAGGIGNPIFRFIILIPFVIIGVSMTLAVPVRLLIRSHGTSIVATVDSTDTRSNHRGFYANYHFLFDGQSHVDRQPVAQNVFNSLKPGQLVAGRAMNFGGWVIPVIDLGDVNGTTRMIAVTAGCWDAAVVFFFWQLMMPIRRERRLVRGGSVVSGTIADRRYRRFRTVMYYISYTYSVDGKQCFNQVRVSRASHDAADIGSAVTVLHDPMQPALSVPYEYCNYEVVDQGRA